MTTRNRIRTLVSLALVALMLFVQSTAAKKIPAQLPAPDGKPPVTNKPVKVYILAGQSNMVGMGNISGAKCRYTGIYLTADPAAPRGDMELYRVGTYKIGSHGIYLSADPKAEHGATASVYKGAYDPATDYDKARPARTETVALGVAKGNLATIAGAHTVVVRGFIDVPESGNYTINPGYGDSAYNVMELGGQEIYRKVPGGQAVKQTVALEADKRYPVKIIYFKGGKVTIAAISFLRYNNPRGIIPPRGHLTLWMEEQKIPPLDRAKSR